MTRALGWSWAALLLALPVAAQAPDADVGCRVCHPGAVRGLQQSPHRRLLLAPPAAGACSACHVGAGAHADAAARLEPVPRVPAVPAASCTACHQGAALAPALAAHARERVGSGAVPPAAPPAAQAAAAAQQDAALHWSGLVELGYRFVARHGSRDGFATDVDLPPGAVLRAFELRGLGGGDSTIDEVAARGQGLGDPRWSVDGELRAGDVRLRSGFDRDRFRYRAGGDFHRVDRDSELAHSEFELGLGDGQRLFASLQHRDDDGFWLTQRIGDRNLAVQTFVDGVASPRHVASDEAEFGVGLRALGLDWSLAGGWFEQDDDAAWSFARPAVADPAFVESEAFATHSTLRGPSLRGSVAGDLGPLHAGLSGRLIERDRRIAAAGSSRGFDLAPFTGSTLASGDGDSRTWLVDADLELPLGQQLRAVADLHWRDHDERLHLRQTDLRVYPTLATTVQVDTVADPATVQRLFDGDLALHWQPVADLELWLGYGFAREQLRVPDLQPQDPLDFRRGHSRDDGVLAGVDYRPARGFRFAADLRDFGRDGVPLHAIEPARTRSAGGSVGFHGDGWQLRAFARHRRDESATSRHHLESFATGAGAGVDAGGLTCDLDYAFARTDTRTLTSFWFDPDPDPVPTFVGFHGDTHTLSMSLGAELGSDLRAELAAALTSTTGSFDVRTFDWRAGLRWQVVDGGSAGVELRQLRYRDDGALGDYGAELLFVYWRQVF